MAAAGAGSNESAKHMFDRIGKKVYKEAENEAQTYKDYLKGNLARSSILGETASTENPCKFEYDKLTDAARGERYPCRKSGEDVKRFSDKRGAQCDKKKIKDSDSNGDACAPFRRLNLCNKNMVKMDTNNNDGKAKHNLLAEVCMAAYYEGDSIKTHYTPHQQIYDDSAAELCTVLARSFADIGDIVRGKDLFRGYNEKDKAQKKKIQDNLKDIFKKIHNGLPEGKKSRYENDTKNYYQLREDWWIANRDQVWEALTCKAEQNDKYFRDACSNDKAGSSGKCRCGDKRNTDPPTYFDYVPQFLRWFEEWAEDFCRKKKKKVENLDTQCRGTDSSGNERYCSRNGYDCTRTIYKKGYFVIDKGCINCLYACNPYVEWIEKQKEQFDKQVKKYTSEMQKYTKVASGNRGRLRRSARGTSTTNYDGYESKFYDELQSNGYGSVDDFLEKLSNEEICTKNTEIKEGGKINFEKVNSGKHSSGGDSGTNDINNGTFYRSEYCQPCPPCGVERNGSGWEEKSGGTCDRQKPYKIRDGAPFNDINVLSFGDKGNEIKQKIDTFCDKTKRNEDTLYEKWKCYEEKDIEKHGVEEEVYNKEVKGAGGLCILPNPKKKEKESDANSQKEPKEIQKTYNDFFYYWVAHMLKDSIHWRTKRLKRCLQNGNRIKCENEKCNSDCVCFQKWIDKKKNEWDKIKQQFSKQTDIPLGCYFTTLELALKLQFLNENTEEHKKNNVSAEEAKEIKQLSKIIEREENQDAPVAAGGCGTGGDSDNEKETLMDKLIEYEKGEAKKCKKCEDTAPKQPDADEPPDGATPQPRPEEDSEDESEEEEEDEDEEDEENEGDTKKKGQTH